MFIVGGFSDSPANADGNKTAGTHGLQDIWLVALQENGTKLWDHTYGGTQDDILETIDLQSNNPSGLAQPVYDACIILSGYSNSNAYAASNGYKTQNNYGPSDGWVILATASNGQQYKDYTVGGTGDDAAMTTKPVLINSVTVDCNYVTLSFSASGISGNKTVASLGGYDLWLHVMERRTYYGGSGSASRVGAGGNETATLGNEISNSVYPTLLKNGDEINVLFDAPGVADGKTVAVLMYSMDGKTIFKETLMYGQKQVIRPAFPAEGIYVLSIRSGDNKLLCSKKIVVQ